MRVAAAVLLLMLAGCAAAPLRLAPAEAVAKVDLDRYMGTWYVIGRTPSYNERRQVAVTVDYARGQDGSIFIVQHSRDQDFTHAPEQLSGRGSVVDPVSNALWSVKFPWSGAQDYAVVYLDDSYQHAIAVDAPHQRVWLLAREARVSDDTYEVYLAVLRAKNFDTDKVVRVPQIEDQLGAPGYTP
ncbi:MAG TPA: lipocalin family protein [Nevskiaceae bacterium]|nr:lipocalin family protein [Nevskiaceae bacterium]